MHSLWVSLPLIGLVRQKKIRKQIAKNRLEASRPPFPDCAG